MTEAITLSKSIYIFSAIGLSQQACLIIFIQSALSHLPPLLKEWACLRMKGIGNSKARYHLWDFFVHVLGSFVCMNV